MVKYRITKEKAGAIRPFLFAKALGIRMDVDIKWRRIRQNIFKVQSTVY
nr:MAG TPA: hypothetical protein [Caudoviricetes sp.]